MSSASSAPSALLSAIRQQSSALNLRPLQRLDSLTRAVVFTGKHTVLYRLDRHSEQWERDNVEGPFFIVERSALPFYQLVILNRLSLEPWVLPLTADARIELQEEHYLFIQSGSSDDVVGVWFYEPNDALQAADRMKQLTALISNPHYQPSTHNTTTTTPEHSTNSRNVADTHRAANSVSKQAQSAARRGHPPVIDTSGRRLHSKPPPPPSLPLSDALDGASEGQLQNRLKAFLGAFKKEDEAYTAAHGHALSQQKQQQHSEATSRSATPPSHAQPHTADVPDSSSQPRNGIPLRVDALFQFAAASEASQPPQPQPFAPAAIRPALTAAELERSLAVDRALPHTHTAASSAQSAQLHPLVSQLFQSQQPAAKAAHTQHSRHHHHHHNHNNQQQQYNATDQTRTTLPSSLSSPSLLSHRTEPPASHHSIAPPPLLTPAALTAASAHSIPQCTLRLSLPSLPATLTQAAFASHAQAALADQRIMADLYTQYCALY